MIKYVHRIREALFLWDRAERWHQEIKPLLSLELASYSRSECMLAAAECPRIEAEQIGVVGLTLWARSGRGKMSLTEALTKYMETLSHTRDCPT